MKESKVKDGKKVVRFTSVLQQFDEKGEKTSWTFITIPPAIAERLKPGCRKSFRVKGKLDSHTISFVALMPMGGGEFILAVNAEMRKAIRKRRGAMLNVELIEDTDKMPLSPELLECLAEDPVIQKYFEGIPASHQRYFSNWIDEARTQATKTRRLATVIEAFEKRMNYSEMMALYRMRS